TDPSDTGGAHLVSYFLGPSTLVVGLSRNHWHIRYSLYISVRLSFRFVFLRRSVAFDLSLFGLSLHVIASRPRCSWDHFEQGGRTSSIHSKLCVNCVTEARKFFGHSQTSEGSIRCAWRA